MKYCTCCGEWVQPEKFVHGFCIECDKKMEELEKGELKVNSITDFNYLD